MATAISLALLLLFFLATLVGSNAALASGDEDQVSFYFSDFEENLEDLTLLGDAKFVRIEGQVDGMAVQLSGTRQNTAGRLLYSLPVRMLDSDGLSFSFSTQFCFSMTSFAGDGMAFVVVPDMTTIGASGPWLGVVSDDEIQNRNRTAKHTFAVEFDSVKNEELRDPNSNHIGVDVETIVSAATADAADAALTLNDGSRKYAWIDYDGQTKILQVRVAGSDGVRPQEALMSHTVELARIWKSWMFVGFSSSTGIAAQKHKVFSWKFWAGMNSSSNSNGRMSLTTDSSRRSPSSVLLRNPIPSSALLRMQHSMPVDADTLASTMAPGASDDDRDDEDGDKSDDKTDDDPAHRRRFRFDPGMLILLLVGFTCGACITLFLVVGWALMLRRSSEARMGYEELS